MTPLSAVQPAALQALLAAARRRSFTEAAAELGLTQSGVSQIIDRLEKQLGLDLFDRSTRPPQLTPDGREVCALAERLVEEAAFFADAVERLRAGEVQSLRFGITEVARSFAGSAIEAALIPLAPVFESRSGLIPKIVSDFAAGEIDVAVAPDIPAEKRLIAHPLLRERYLLVHPKTEDVPADDMPVSELKRRLQLSFVSYRQDSMDWRKSLSMLRLLGIAPKHAIALENTDAVASAVASGLGWSILSPMSLWCIRSRLDAVTIHGLGELSAEKVLWAASQSKRFAAFAAKAAAVFRDGFEKEWLPQMEAKKPGFSRYAALLREDGGA